MNQHHHSIKMNRPTLGVCYYPEHWPREMWQDDLRRMKEHGIEVVRVFEFAWCIVEPYEGVYDFELFDSFLDLAAREGIRVIMCTPTATPPAWLTKQHPEVLNADVDGNLMYHGHRRHYNYNSEKYIYYTERIVGRLAARYGNHPAIIGWQIDNEINCEINEFYSDADRKAFRQYLRARFGTLESLNEAIGANFWSQRYSDWSEVDLSRHTLHGLGNPHLSLLEKSFFSQSAIRFVKLQSDILRKHVGDRFVTTNGIFGHLDNFEMVDTALDFITYDSYPNFAYGEEGINSGGKAKGKADLGDRSWSMNLSYARALSPNFGVMEQQSGANGWDFRMLAPMPKPGQMRLWTMQSIAHGADYVSYFRWRTCAYGTEIYWHGLNDYSNEPNRRLDELKKIHQDLSGIRNVVGSLYQARVALAWDYLNEWDGERDLWHGPLDRASRQNIFAAAQRSHTPIDLIWLRSTNAHCTRLEELQKYDVVFYPHATILTEDIAELLRAYVEAGGKLIMGARTGYKDEYGRCPMKPMPGEAAELCGVKVIDYTLARPEDPAVIVWNGKSYEAPQFHDILRPENGGEGVATFSGCYYDGACAMTVKKYGNGGRAYYLGSGFTLEMAAALLEDTGVITPYREVIECPEEVELALRSGKGQDYYFVLNYTGEPQTVSLHRQLRDAFTGQEVQGEIALTAYEAKVFIMEK